MELKIDLQELDDGIQRYEGLVKDFQDCQSQMKEIIMDLGSCWTGVHAVTTLIRLTALGQFIEAYHSHLNTLTAEDRPSAERIYNQLLIRQYQLGNVDTTELRNPVEGRYADYISGKAEKWLTPGYKMTRLDIMEAKRMMEGFSKERFGQGVIDNNRLVPDENLTRLRVRNRDQLEDLGHKMSPYSNFTISAVNSVPLMGKVLDTVGQWRPKPPGSEYLESSRFSTMAANSRTQNKAMSYLGNFAGQMGTYYVANKAIQSIPKIGSAIGAASEKLGKWPVLNQVDTRHIANVLSGLVADVTVDTVPSAVDDTMEGQSIKKIIANISLNVLGNVGYNIIGEGMGSWFDDFADGFKLEFEDEITKGRSDLLRYEEYWRQRGLLSQSTCSDETLYQYLYNIDPNKAIDFAKTGHWPTDIQIPKNSNVLNRTWGIDWSQIPGGGYVLDVNGNPIKSEYIPQINDILDRYGPPTGTYTSPVENGIPYNYNERSLPYVEDKSLYHQYRVKGDFTNIKYYIDNCKNPELKAQVEAAILKYYGGNYDRLKTHIGDIAPGFESSKGGIQVQLPLTVEQLKGLGLIEELK